MLVPALVRAKLPDAKIAFFCTSLPAHGGFPHSALGVAAGNFAWLAGADLVGFHTEEYTVFFA